ncbi:MAG TPA: hypothetical protein VLX68_02665 [Chitinivibrionales bacterium]|nr:hypothetical protein [Chitinivibrionales bacterium]
MRKSILIIFLISILSSNLFGKDNRISLELGYPDLFGIEYQRNINNFYIAFSPHILASVLFCNWNNYYYNYKFYIAPSLSFGYIFIKKRIFELGSDLIVTTGYFDKIYEDTLRETQFELDYGLRINPSFTFSKITLSIFGGFFIEHILKPYEYVIYPNGNFTLQPSFALKLGYNF